MTGKKDDLYSFANHVIQCEGEKEKKKPSLCLLKIYSFVHMNTGIT